MAWPGAWPSQVIFESRRRLVDLRDEVDTLPIGTSPEILQALSRFLVVRACGHIEFTFTESFSSFVESRSNPKVATYVRSRFARGFNPVPSRLTDEAQKLDSQFSDLLKLHLEDDDKYSERQLKALVAFRNQIAHGQSENVSRRKALDLTKVSLDFGDWIIDVFDPKL